MKKQIRILIVDDHAMVRYALANAIRCQRDLSLVGEADDGQEALTLYRAHQPDVVTMDYNLPGQNGIATTSAIRAEFPQARVLLLSIHEGAEDIWKASQAGAVGYLSKSVEIDEVLLAIRQVAGGTPYFSNGLAEKLASHQPRDSLTPRELDVLRLIVAGLSNKEITASLNISQSTMKGHLERIFVKLHVYDRTQAAAAAIHRGIVHIDM
jgi:DNA-binding NarL/FixJ family response regulator